MKSSSVRKAVFPVAGWGTRFLPATKHMPKEMLAVIDKPVIQYAVEEAMDAGIEEFIFITGRGKDAIENHLDRNFELEEMLERTGKADKLKSITHIVPEEGKVFYTRQANRKGLGHAVGLAKNAVGDEPFAVLLPDDIMVSHTEPNMLRHMIDLYEKTKTSVVLTTKVTDEETQRYGVLDTDAKENGHINVKGFVEKPKLGTAPSNYAVMGRYVFTPRVFDFLENAEPGAGGEIQLTDAMHKLAQEEGFCGHLLDGLRLDCGDKPGYVLATLYMALKRDDIRPHVEAFLKEKL